MLYCDFMQITTLGPDDQNRYYITLHDVPGIVVIKEGNEKRFGAYFCIKADDSGKIPIYLRSPRTIFMDSELNEHWGWYDEHRPDAPYGYRCWWSWMTNDTVLKCFEFFINIYNKNMGLP